MVALQYLSCKAVVQLDCIKAHVDSDKENATASIEELVIPQLELFEHMQHQVLTERSKLQIKLANLLTTDDDWLSEI